MQEQFRAVIRQKILDTQTAALPVLTRRDVWLPAVPGKAMAVIGMRRAGKTSFLWQQLTRRHAQGTARELVAMLNLPADERAALGQQARARVQENYEIGHVTRMYEAMHARVVGAELLQPENTRNVY